MDLFLLTTKRRWEVLKITTVRVLRMRKVMKIAEENKIRYSMKLNASILLRCLGLSLPLDFWRSMLKFFDAGNSSDALC
jgi:hypothetical protein